MITYNKARFVLNGIKSINVVSEIVHELQTQIDDLEQKKADLASPKSPNGRESIGEAKGNSVSDYTQELVTIITEQDKLKKEEKFYINMLERFKRYEMMLTDGEDSDYSQMYFKKYDREAICHKYRITNPFDRMIRIIRKNIKSLW